MRRFVFATCTVLLLSGAALLASCETTDAEEPGAAPSARTETVTTQPARQPEAQPARPAAPAQTEAPASRPAEKTEADIEYEKSIAQLSSASVSKETFEADKAIILQKIEELDQIMRRKDYRKWVTYLDDESVRYWQDKTNLQSISTKLPVKGLRLTSLEDYFNYVFIGSRVGRTVDQIRYITDSDVNAVQAREDYDVVYYTFRKVGGEWKVHLRTLEEM